MRKRYLILQKKDTGPWYVLSCDNIQEAHDLFDQLSVSWSETYLVTVMRGPKDFMDGKA